jgi:hypothetical protein
VGTFLKPVFGLFFYFAFTFAFAFVGSFLSIQKSQRQKVETLYLARNKNEEIKSLLFFSF